VTTEETRTKGVLHMEVILDGVPGFVVEGDPQDALAVVVAASDYLQEQGRAVLSLAMDGQAISPDGLADALKDRPLDSIRKIEITSESLLDLVDQTLRELEEVLPELPQACHDLAEVFQGDDPEAGFTPFHQLAEIWRNVKIRETQVLHALNEDAESLAVREAPLSKVHNELNEFLTEAAQAIEAGDLILLGDLLEYELAPRAEMEIDIVALLRQRAARLTEG